MEYTIIQATRKPELVQTINELLARGWVCQGGIVVDSGQFYQAMIRDTSMA